MKVISKKKFYINGQWVDPLEGKDFEVINPSNEEVCAIISLGGNADTDAAIKAAKDTFNSWWNISKENKLNLLNNLELLYQLFLST